MTLWNKSITVRHKLVLSVNATSDLCVIH